MSPRLRAQFGLVSACAVLAGTMTILYRGSRNPELQTQPTNVVQKTSAMAATPVHALVPGK